MFSVIFEVHPAPGRRDAYLALAAEMRPVLESIDGFLHNERFESRRRPGWVLSHSTWRDEKALIRWRTEMRHHLTQAKGRAGLFADYHLRVGEVTRDDPPQPGLVLRGQRFDVTEVGRAPLCTLTDFDGAGAIPLDLASPGLVDHDVFASLTTPGRLTLLCAWTGPKAADAVRPAGAARHRAVRIIRDYALRDRREAPQYFPDPPGNGIPGVAEVA